MHVVWFKRDLRVHDHAPLTAALATGEPVLCLYILEPTLWSLPDMSGRHFGFLLGCLEDLDRGLKCRGGALVVRIGEAVEVLAGLHRAQPITAIHAHEETGLLWTYTRDRAVRAWAKAQGITVREQRQHGVWRGPISRDGWARRWEALMAQPTLAAPSGGRFCQLNSDPLPTPAQLGLAPDPIRDPQAGGRMAGVGLLASFLKTRGRSYRRAMSSPMAGAEACSRLSPHLAYGSLSMREVTQAARRAQAQYRAGGDLVFAQALGSFVSRLHWHCHFIQKLEDAPMLEREDLHPAYAGLRPIGPDHGALVQAWATGHTGFPFVDACMRSLQATGWLNFRMRAMVMAFSSYHLWQDWRAPAQALARLFTDFEPGIHYPQAQMQSGTTGVNTARIYNPVKQSIDQDPDGQFIRAFVPELAHLPTALLHAPWEATAADLAARGVVLGQTYPKRLVDHVAAGAAARARVYAVRQGPAYRQQADQIQAAHGSRRSGLPPTGVKRKPVTENPQPDLFGPVPAKPKRPKASRGSPS